MKFESLSLSKFKAFEKNVIGNLHHMVIDIIVFVFESLSHGEEMDEARILYVVF